MDKIITENLIIREFTIDDVSAYSKNNNDEQIKEYMPNHWHGDENKAKEEIEEFISCYERMKTETEYHFAIVKDDVLIGHIGIGESDDIDEENAREICCAISRDYRGFHYAAEAVTGFVPWCLSTFGLEKIYTSTNRDNISASKSLLKAGFHLTDIKIINKELNVYVFT